MRNKINDIELSKIETENERHWFSVIKQKAVESRFGKLEMSLTVKNGKVSNVCIIKGSENFNTGG